MGRVRFRFWICANLWQSGKILRKVLRERAKKEVGDKDPVQAKL